MIRTVRKSVIKPLLLIIFIFLGSFTLVSASFLMLIDYRNQRAGVFDTFENIEKSHIESLEQNVWILDEQLVLSQMEGILQLPYVRFLMLDIKGYSIYTQGEHPPENRRLSRMYYLSHVTGDSPDVSESIGTLYVEASTEEIYQAVVGNAVMVFSLQAVNILIIALVIFFLFYFKVSRHLVRIRDYAAGLTLDTMDRVLVLDRPERGTNDGDELSVLVNTLNNMQEVIRDDLTHRELYQKELNRLHLMLENITNSITSVLITVDRDLKIMHLNRCALESYGLTEENSLGMDLVAVIPFLRSEEPVFREILNQPQVKYLRKIERQSPDRTRFFDLTFYPLLKSSMEGIVLRVDDVTGQVALEQKLIHSSKMEAIGQLSGGIAHDFNNMLGGITGAAQLLSGRVDKESEKYVDLILQAAERSAALTSKLLTFSRKRAMESIPVDLHKVLTHAVDLMERSLDKKVNILMNFNAERHAITGDDPSLLNAFLNLGINAGHAMPDGGSFSLTTSDVFLGEDDCRESLFDLNPGEYIEISAGDTGKGIPAEMQARIFEPFFTTREKGKGTGLGLTAVYETVKAHRGEIVFTSTPEEGTVFRIRLPLRSGPVPGVMPEKKNLTGSGRILVVDDEAMILNTTCTLLKELGYDVFPAENGSQALEIFKGQRGAVDLVLLDMIMPGMNGLETFRALRAVDPAIRIIIASGYSRDEDLLELEKEGYSGFIQKPYRSTDLSRLVHQALQSVDE